jgi:hypothetical protein
MKTNNERQQDFHARKLAAGFIKKYFYLKQAEYKKVKMFI